LDPATLRLKTLASYGNSFEIMAALGVNAGASPKAGALDSLKIDACDDYVKDMRECLGSIEAKTRDATTTVLNEQLAGWKADIAAGKSTDLVKAACLAASVNGRGTYAAQCPRVEWN